METWNCVYMIHDIYIAMLIYTTAELWIWGPWNCVYMIQLYNTFISIYINMYINLCICICIMNTNPYTNMVPTLLSSNFDSSSPAW